MKNSLFSSKCIIFGGGVNVGEDKSGVSAGEKKFFIVKNPEKIFTTFTVVSIRHFVTTQPPKKRHFLRIGIAKVKESEHYVL